MVMGKEISGLDGIYDSISFVYGTRVLSGNLLKERCNVLRPVQGCYPQLILKNKIMYTTPRSLYHHYFPFLL